MSIACDLIKWFQQMILKWCFYSSQGAFSLVIEAWYSPAEDQPGGEPIILFTTRGRHSKYSGLHLITLQRLPSVNVLADACGFPCFRVCYDALSHTTIPYNHISPAQSRFPCFIFGMHGKVHKLKWERQDLPKVPWQPLPGFYTFFVGSFITGS